MQGCNPPARDGLCWWGNWGSTGSADPPQTQEVKPLQHVKSPAWRRRRRYSSILETRAALGGQRPPAPSTAQVRMPQPGKATTTAGMKGKERGGWKGEAMRPIQRSVTFRSPRAAIRRAEQAAHCTSKEQAQPQALPGPRPPAPGERTERKHPKSTFPTLRTCSPSPG